MWRGRPGSTVAKAARPAAGAVGLADRDGPVELHDRAAGEPEQLVVPADDLHPVGLLGARRVGVQGGDRGLGLELAEPVATQRRLQDGDALGDERGVPAGAVLLGQRDQAAVAPGPRRSPGVVQQHQRQQPRGLLVVGHRRQLPGEPDRLGRQVDVAGVALVEDQVEHPQHRRQVAGLGRTARRATVRLARLIRCAIVASGTR